MHEAILIHYGELALKKGNRNHFERKLARNIRSSLVDLGKVEVERLFGRMLLEPGNIPFEKVEERLSHTFGIAHFGRAMVTEMTWSDLLEATAAILPTDPQLTFGVRTKKAEERWSRGRTETNRDLGAWIVEQRGWGVNLREPDLWVQVEIASGRIMVCCEKRPGARGLPVSVSGKGLALLSGGIDSPVAAHAMMSRGLQLSFAHFHSAPYTNRLSQDKVVDLARRLLLFQPKIRLHMIPFAPIQREIVQKTPQSFRVLLYRRFMMRIASKLAWKDRAKALITGESLGQVASQTLTNIRTVEAVSEYTIFRPLVGLDKETITAIAQKAGTYEISIQPHDDCCSYLMPAKPATKSSPKEATFMEQDLDVEGLVEACLENVETMKLKLGDDA